MDQQIKAWLEFAQQDLEVAKHLDAVFYPKPIEIICYHCQQSAEKAIKAVILYCGLPGGLPRRHDLSLLLDQVHNHIAVEDSIYDCADQLSPYGVAARYPNEMMLEDRHAKQAIRYAETVLQWAKESSAL